MKTQLSVLALSAIMIASLSTAPIYGQQMMGDISQPITVSVDKPTYNEGDTIMISGAVARSGDGDVTIQIVGPDDSQNIAGVAQSTVNRDGTFEAEIKAGGTMNRDGTYTVNAQYGSIMTVEATTTFEFIAADIIDMDPVDRPGVAANIGDDTITMEGTDDTISYEITGGKILSVVPDVESNSLVITIESTDDGVLTMTIPRTILESMEGDEDSDLFILIDGEEREFDVDTTETSRTVTVEFEYGAEIIEIIGTWVVPEFGVIAVMILAVAIVATIVVSSRSRLSIMAPKL
ncbi:MAG: PEFG-CTERM sorting domain-containing protein [Thaumarchaeota archaeon]|nr:PEFG-CTERM sorting domain-containing protein [Nitrososphaerota archaeon]MDE0266033.1 PEFG-CTERM sorting domain-containing protein [Nitrososphaerota archaeon]MDE0526020.1 PEFG-CTERM sorting domain-containing protein [Nitrososphaerota archaeon]